MTLTIPVPLPPKFLERGSRAHISKKMHASIMYSVESDWAAKAQLFARFGDAKHFSGINAVKVQYRVKYNGSPPKDGEAFIVLMTPAITGLQNQGLLSKDCAIEYMTPTARPAFGRPSVDIVLDWEA